MDTFVIYGIAIVGMTVVAVLFVKMNSGATQPSSSKLQALLSEAALAKRSGNYSQAEMLYQSAVSQIDGSKVPDDALLSSALAGQADAHERMGNHRQAMELRNRMLALWRKALEQQRNDFLMDIDYQCSNEEFGASTRDVADFYETVLAYREKRVPQHSWEFTGTIVIYARLLRALGEKEIADQLEEKAESLKKSGPSGGGSNT